MSISAEQEFWNAFSYNVEANTWTLAPGLYPMDILEISRKKLGADRQAVAKVLEDGPTIQLRGDEADPLVTAVFLCLGAASVCWDSMDGTGVFQSERAEAIGNELVAFIRARMTKALGQDATEALTKETRSKDRDCWGCNSEVDEDEGVLRMIDADGHGSGRWVLFHRECR